MASMTKELMFLLILLLLDRMIPIQFNELQLILAIKCGKKVKRWSPKEKKDH